MSIEPIDAAVEHREIARAKLHWYLSRAALAVLSTDGGIGRPFDDLMGEIAAVAEEMKRAQQEVFSAPPPKRPRPSPDKFCTVCGSNAVYGWYTMPRCVHHLPEGVHVD